VMADRIFPSSTYAKVRRRKKRGGRHHDGSFPNVSRSRTVTTFA
jgi:hypothetical protein